MVCNTKGLCIQFLSIQSCSCVPFRHPRYCPLCLPYHKLKVISSPPQALSSLECTLCCLERQVTVPPLQTQATEAFCIQPPAFTSIISAGYHLFPSKSYTCMRTYMSLMLMNSSCSSRTLF